MSKKVSQKPGKWLGATEEHHGGSAHRNFDTKSAGGALLNGGLLLTTPPYARSDAIRKYKQSCVETSKSGRSGEDPRARAH